MSLEVLKHHNETEANRMTGCSKVSTDRCKGCPCSRGAAFSQCPTSVASVQRVIRPETANTNGASLEVRFLAAE